MTKDEYSAIARRKLGFRVVALGGALLALQAASVWGQGLTYVEADGSNLTPLAAITTVSADDDLWLQRLFGIGSTIYESGNEQPPELTQNIPLGAGITAGTSYDVYVVHWTNSSNWTIAGGLTPGQEVIYNRAGPNPNFPTAMVSTPAAFSQWTTLPPIVQEGDRVMVIGKIGTTTATASGINVYINDPGGGGTGDTRSFFDGVAFAPAAAPVTLSATIDRVTGNLTINNPTSTSFTVKSITIDSGAGTLDVAAWNSITNTADANSGGSFDPDDVWGETSALATKLEEAELTTPNPPIVLGGTLAAGSSLNLGNVSRKSVYEDVSVVLSLNDIDAIAGTNDTFRLIANYTGGSEIAAGDLNADGVVDIANDYASLVDNLNSGVSSGPNAYERYLLGDLTNNDRVSYADLVAFRLAFDAANGPGAFAAAVGVPEPGALALAALGMCGLAVSARRRRRSTGPAALSTTEKSDCERCDSTGEMNSMSKLRHTGLVLAIAVSVAASASTALAAPVTGWAIDPSFGLITQPAPAPDPVLSGAATASPTLGDGTRNNADDVGLFASFPQVSLADGQEVKLTGSVTVQGADNPSGGNFRWGLLFEGGTADTFGWLGYLAENSSGDSGATLNSKNPLGQAFGTTTFASTTGSPARAIGIGNALHNEALFADGTYNFQLTVGRFGNDVSVTSKLTSASGYSSIVFPSTDAGSAGRRTFNFNRVGFLGGSGINADQLSFSNIDVTSAAAISALTLRVTTSGANAGTTEIVNSVTGAPVDLAYYEIASAGGSLDLGGYVSLDEGESDAIGLGWEEAGGNSGVIISEGNLQGSSTIAINGLLNLGSAFDAGGVEDLRFQYGLPDGTLIRGMVEYVAGPGNLPGDFNGDQVVDAADLTQWKGDFGVANGGSDADGDGDSDGQDFLVWQRNLGNPPVTAAASAVPEPATLALAAMALAPLAARRRVGRCR